MQFYSESHPALFNKHKLLIRLAEEAKDCAKAADELPRERFAAQNDEQLAQEIVEDNTLTPLHVDTANYTIEEREVVILEKQGGGTTIVLDLYMPFSGNPGLVHCRPTRPPRKSVHGKTTESSIVLTFLQGQPAQLKRQIATEIGLIEDWVEAVNADVEMATHRTKNDVLDRLRRRRMRFSQSNALLAALDIPIRKAPSEQTLEIPVTRRRVTPETTATVELDRREWRLSDAIYQQIVITITRFSHALERRPSSARALLPDEETLRDWLIFMLNSSYETDSGDEVFTASEALNGRGKTDILVHHQGRNVFIGECKFWSGPKAFRAAIDQLLGYLVWRDTKAALILFITQKDAGAIISKADRCIRDHSQFDTAAPAKQPNQRRDYTLISPQDASRSISLALIPVVIGPSPHLPKR